MSNVSFQKSSVSVNVSGGGIPYIYRGRDKFIKTLTKEQQDALLATLEQIKNQDDYQRNNPCNRVRVGLGNVLHTLASNIEYLATLLTGPRRGR